MNKSCQINLTFLDRHTRLIGQDNIVVNVPWHLKVFHDTILDQTKPKQKIYLGSQNRTMR